jgi:hypothetical protein
MTYNILFSESCSVLKSSLSFGKFGQKGIKIQKNSLVERFWVAPVKHKSNIVTYTIVAPVLIFIFFYHHTLPNLSSVSSAET